MLFMMLLAFLPNRRLLFVVPAMIVLRAREWFIDPSDFITAWIVMAFGGFLQWFMLVPRFLQKPDLTAAEIGNVLNVSRRRVLRTRTLPSREAIATGSVVKDNRSRNTAAGPIKNCSTCQ